MSYSYLFKYIIIGDTGKSTSNKGESSQVVGCLAAVGRSM